MTLACPKCGAKFSPRGRRHLKRLAKQIGATLDVHHLCGMCFTVSAEAPDGTLTAKGSLPSARSVKYCNLMGEIVCASAALCGDCPDPNESEFVKRVTGACSAVQGNRPNTAEPSLADLKLLMIATMRECIAELEK